MTEDEANGNVIQSNKTQTMHVVPTSATVYDNSVVGTSPSRNSSSSDGSNPSDLKKKDFESEYIT